MRVTGHRGATDPLNSSQVFLSACRLMLALVKSEHEVKRGSLPKVALYCSCTGHSIADLNWEKVSCRVA